MKYKKHTLPGAQKMGVFPQNVLVYAFRLKKPATLSQEQLDTVLNVIESLPESYSACIYGFFQDGLDMDELVQLSGCKSKDWARRTLLRAVARMTSRLIESGLFCEYEEVLLTPQREREAKRQQEFDDALQTIKEKCPLTHDWMLTSDVFVSREQVLSFAEYLNGQSASSEQN